MGTMVEFKRPDGKAATGWLVEAPQALAAVVVIQEWWGLNDQIRGVAERLASAGFSALVPDLYRGKSTLEAEEAHHLMSGLDFGDAASNDVRGAVQFLKARRVGSGKVGITGYCMGGALTVLSLTMVPEADAGVIWYGLPPLEYVDASKIGARPVMAHWATQDQAFSIDKVDALEARLREARVHYEGHRYLAHHGFANETALGPRRIPITQYDPVWAQQAWDRTMRFFGHALS
jgi:carboxymethylenebutenolidase